MKFYTHTIITQREVEVAKLYVAVDSNQKEFQIVRVGNYIHPEDAKIAAEILTDKVRQELKRKTLLSFKRKMKRVLDNE